MRKILLALSLLLAVSSSALSVDEMLARFNKVKQKSKHRHGVSVEVYVNVQSELAPSRSGNYEADFGRSLTLDVRRDGTVTGSGDDDGQKVELKKMVLDQCRGTEFPILFDVDIGHTDPILTIPLNALARLDSEGDEFAVLEAGVVESVTKGRS